MQRFDGSDLRPVALGGQQQAGADGFAVHNHGAGSALAHRAALFGAGELQLLAQKIDQADIVFHIAGNADAIHF